MVTVANPSNFASVLPFSLLLDALLTYVGADTVLLTGLPQTNIFAAISPYEFSLALALVVYELARIHLAVLPFELALAVHFVLAPVSSVALAIRPVIVSETADLVHLELSFVVAAVSESKPALPLLFPVLVAPLVTRAIRP